MGSDGDDGWVYDGIVERLCYLNLFFSSILGISNPRH